MLRVAGTDGVLLSLGDFRTPVLSLRMARDVAGPDGFDGFMRLRITPVSVCRIQAASLFYRREDYRIGYC